MDDGRGTIDDYARATFCKRNDRLLRRKARKDNAARNDGETNVVIARRSVSSWLLTKQSGHFVIVRKPE
jgi:hypothetical protein